MSDQPQPQIPQELQGLFAEALFWKQAYLQQQQHYTQVFAMLSRPPASPGQVANMIGLPNVNGAPEPPQPSEQAS